MKQIGLAIHNYAAAHDCLPCGGGGNNYTSAKPGHVSADNADRMGSWACMILPFMDRLGHYNMFDFNYSMGDSHNTPAVLVSVSSYICPSDPAGAVTKTVVRNGANVTLTPGVMTNRDCYGGGMTQELGMGLWYLGSVGPTNSLKCNSTIPFCECTGGTLKPNCYCCWGGWAYGAGNDSSVWPPVAGRTAGMFAAFMIPVIRFSDATDGTSNTFMCGEALPGNCICISAFGTKWPLAVTTIPLNDRSSYLCTDFSGSTVPYTGTCADAPLIDVSDPVNGANRALDNRLMQPYEVCQGFRSMHPNGANFLMADGSVHFLNDFIDYKLYNRLGIKSDRLLTATTGEAAIKVLAPAPD